VKVRVDPGLCDAYGKCAKVAPEIFHLDEFGYASTEEDAPVPEELEAKAREAVGTCPADAISMIEE
jgi:ferredoxin